MLSLLQGAETVAAVGRVLSNQSNLENSSSPSASEQKTLSPPASPKQFGKNTSTDTLISKSPTSLNHSAERQIKERKQISLQEQTAGKDLEALSTVRAEPGKHITKAAPPKTGVNLRVNSSTIALETELQYVNLAFFTSTHCWYLSYKTSSYFFYFLFKKVFINFFFLV